MAQVLEQASTVTATPDGPIEMVDYVISLREGIMDAWGGIIGAMKSSGKSRWQAPGICGLPSVYHHQFTNPFTAQALQQYVPAIFNLLGQIANDTIRSEGLLRASMGVIGYV